MKRTTYVDNQGNPIDQTFESRKPILYIFFTIGTILPIVIIGVIIFTIVQNNSCDKVYKAIKTATLSYLKEEDRLPQIEGENTTVSIPKLYTENFLNTFNTKDMKCSGNIKVTKYKNDYVYTLNVTNCNTCATNTRYGNWSGEISTYPKNKQVIDVIPYYNYYERQIVTTDWSKYYDKEQLDTKKSKYGIYLPTEDKMDSMPEVPEEGNIVEAQKEEILNYRYKDKRWKWYDIVGNYSSFSSEQPAGFTNKDEDTKTYTEWSKYSLTYPEEKTYRDISKATGYQYYYEDEKGTKVYANNKNYTVAEEIDTTKYNRHENEGVDMYRYRDSQWRWYTGQKRRYSVFYSEQPRSFPYRDDEIMSETEFSSWDKTSKLTEANKSYRTEETKTMTRFRYLYEILSDPVLKSPVTKEQFVKEIKTSVPEFVTDENYKMEVTYKFKYQKR